MGFRIVVLFDIDALKQKDLINKMGFNGEAVHSRL